jgi:hypothetical protein
MLVLVLRYLTQALVTLIYRKALVSVACSHLRRQHR